MDNTHETAAVATCLEWNHANDNTQREASVLTVFTTLHGIKQTSRSHVKHPRNI